ncbi:MAG: lactonase family protein, partial [Armatimonadota bacterium]|nr:lactonase family protein [Armatimonadota bacterium]
AAPSHAHNSFVYVTNYGDGTVSQFRVKSNGRLTPLNPPTVKAYPRCHSLAVARGRFLYALSSLEFSRRDCLISQFRIGSDGRLTPLSPPTVLVPYRGQGGGPFLVSTDPTGRFVYVPGRDGSIAQFRISAGGELRPLDPPQAAGVGDDCHVAYDTSHRLLYVTGYGRMIVEAFGSVQAYRLTAPGNLSLLPKSRMDTIVRGISVTRGGQFAYLFAYRRNDRRPEEVKTVVSEYRTTPQGVLLPLRTPRVSPSGMASHSLVDPRGRFFYMTIPDEYWVYGDEFDRRLVRGTFLERCKIQPNGTLRRLPWQTLRVQADVSAAAFDSAGHFLYLLTGNGVRSFRVRPDGSVSSLSPCSIHAGRGPLGMVYVQK